MDTFHLTNHERRQLSSAYPGARLSQFIRSLILRWYQSGITMCDIFSRIPELSREEIQAIIDTESHEDSHLEPEIQSSQSSYSPETKPVLEPQSEQKNEKDGSEANKKESENKQKNAHSKISLSDKELSSLRAALKHASVQNMPKILAILGLHNGYLQKEIADFLCRSVDSIQRWKRCYLKDGLEGLLACHYKGRRAFLSREQIEILRKELVSCFYRRAKDVGHFIQQRFNILYTSRTVRYLLNRMGLSYRFPKILPGKPNQQARKDYLQKLEELREEHPDGVFIYLDACHPQQGDVLAKVWAPKDVEVGIRTGSGRGRVNIYGGYCPDTGKTVCKTYDTINAVSVRNFLRYLRQQYPKHIPLIVIADNARYNYARIVREYASEHNITFLMLPPYSPDYNPIERLWGLLKEDLALTYYESIEDFKRAVVAIMRGFHRRKEEVMQRASDNLRKLDAVKALEKKTS